jgi:general L-amino acid transport system permease protein
MADQPQTTKTDNSILYSIAFRGIAYQVLLAGGIALLIWYLYSNVNENLARQNIATGWSFLGEPAGFDISESIISGTRAA